MTVLEFVTGGTPDNPPRTPTETFDLAGNGLSERVYLPFDGFSAAAPGNRVYTRPRARYGQRLVDSEADNTTIELYSDLSGTGYTQIEYARAQIAKYIRLAEAYELGGTGEPVWIRHRWTSNDLKDIAEPEWGQWSRYWRVLGADMEWPSGLHAGQLISGNVERLVTRIVCAPAAMGHRQRALDADGIPGEDSDIALSTTLSGSEMDGNFTIAGWNKLVDGAFTWEYYVDSNNFFTRFC